MATKRSLVLQATALGNTLRQACAAAGVTRSTVLEWRKSDKAFSAKYDEAVEAAADRLEEILFERISGEKPSDILLIFALKKARPAYRDTYRAEVAPVTINVVSFRDKFEAFRAQLLEATAIQNEQRQKMLDQQGDGTAPIMIEGSVSKRD